MLSAARLKNKKINLFAGLKGPSAICSVGATTHDLCGVVCPLIGKYKLSCSLGLSVCRFMIKIQLLHIVSRVLGISGFQAVRWKGGKEEGGMQSRTNTHTNTHICIYTEARTHMPRTSCPHDTLNPGLIHHDH